MIESDILVPVGNVRGLVGSCTTIREELGQEVARNRETPVHVYQPIVRTMPYECKTTHQ